LRILAGLLVIGLIWTAGLFAFADRLSRLTPAPLPDLGVTAADTLGNARETAEWARAMRFRGLIIVTADFHMPRAMLELKTALPDLELRSYAAATPALDARRWRETRSGARLMILEYSKYMAVLARETIRSLKPGGDAPRKESP